MAPRIAIFVLLALCSLGCNRRAGVQNEAAVRQGVIDYLSQRQDLNVSQLQVDVASVSFRENEADALVSIRPRGGGAGGMQVRYTLERKGDRWVVKGKAHGGDAAHGQGTMGQMPPGHPPMGGQSGAAAPEAPARPQSTPQTKSAEKGK